MSILTDAMKLINGLSSPETGLSLKRQAICRMCPLLRYVGPIERCAPPAEGGCGCVIAAKTRIATESCPQGRW